MTAFYVCAFDYKYTGKERDTESGLDYFGARYYGSSMGRFMSPDWSAKAEPVPYSKLDDPQTLNLYAYVRNNPLTSVNPDGHRQPNLTDRFGCSEDEYCLGSAELFNSLQQSTAPNNTASGQPSIGSTSAPLSFELVPSLDPKSDNIQYDPPKDATITINDSIKGDSKTVQDTLGHETGHAHDARTNSDQFGHDSQHTKETKGKTPHDDRPEEKRANQFKEKVNKEIKQSQKEDKP